MYYKFIIKSPATCAVTIDGKFIGESGSMPLVVRAAKKGSYFINAVFAADTGRIYKDIAIVFRPIDMHGYDCADVIRYSADTYVLQLSARPIAATGIFRPLEQVIFEQAGMLHTATLYSDGIGYLELECGDTLTKKPIDYKIDSPSLLPITLSGSSLLLLIGKSRSGNNRIHAYYYSGSEYVSLKLCSAGDYRLQDDTLIIDDNCRTAMRHSMQSVYIFNDNALTLKQPPAVVVGMQAATLDKRLIPYLFLEAVMTGSEEEAIGYLDKQQYAEIQFVQLENYFGEYNLVIHNFFDSMYSDCVGLIKSAGDNYYIAEYYRFEVHNLAIQNIVKIN